MSKHNAEAPIMAIREVSKSYGGVHAVRDVTLDIDSTKITALIGPNGAGKTTLFNLISGFGTPYSGTITFGDTDLTGLSPHRVAKAGIVRTFQTPVGFSSMTVAENVAVAIAGQGLANPWSPFLRWREDKHTHVDALDAARDQLALAGIEDLADTAISDLSPGSAKLVEITRQLSMGPKMLLLDEPAAAMAVDQIKTLSELIRGIIADGVGVLVIDHNLGFVLDLADMVHVLEFGAVVASGTPTEIGRNERVREIYLGGVEESDAA
ncbi:ABC transporter ATP-binding protein [Rhodococcus sp. NPDC057529]|uniref:ABC transporter ATP-binding protein n=1 Tax=Rhodococcus sp. NPDC057529 TaxID=3346158 RepID=UPI00366CBDE4